jgi:hypothetical protein
MIHVGTNIAVFFFSSFSVKKKMSFGSIGKLTPKYILFYNTFSNIIFDTYLCV